MTDSHDFTATEADERRRVIALYANIADLVQLEPNHRGVYDLLTKEAAQEYTFPGSLRRHVAAIVVLASMPVP